MAIIGIATTWWHGLCMRCGATWGIWMEQPSEEPFCYLDGVHVLLYEGTLSTEPLGNDIKFLLQFPFSKDGECRVISGA